MRVQAAQQLPESRPVMHLFVWQGFPLHLNNAGTLPRGKTHSGRCDRQEFLFPSHVCYIISCVTSHEFLHAEKWRFGQQNSSSGIHPGQNLVVRDLPLLPPSHVACNLLCGVNGTATRRR